MGEEAISQEGLSILLTEMEARFEKFMVVALDSQLVKMKNMILEWDNVVRKELADQAKDTQKLQSRIEVLEGKETILEKHKTLAITFIICFFTCAAAIAGAYITKS